MTELVRQRTTHDCAPCCFAMLTGKPLDEVITLLGDNFDEVRGHHGDYSSMLRLGFHEEDFMSIRRDWCLSPELFLRFAWGRRALMTVPSLNHPGGFHMVYWDGNKLLDPCSQKTYSSWDELKPTSMVIMHEARS